MKPIRVEKIRIAETVLRRAFGYQDQRKDNQPGAKGIWSN